MKQVTCVGKMRIFTCIYIRILHVGTSANPHFTPDPRMQRMSVIASFQKIPSSWVG